MRAAAGGLVLLLLTTATLLRAEEDPEETEVGPPKCHPLCTKYGTCGEGGCRCPFGRLGEACEIDFLAPCKPSPDGLPNCGLEITKSCECMRRCQAYFCQTTSDGRQLCRGRETGAELFHEERGCYERIGVPPDEQYSAIPEPDDESVRCFSSHKMDRAPLACPEALYARGGDGMNVEMSLCPGGCGGRGYCVRHPDDQEGPGVCRCHRGFSGEHCEEEENLCFKGCNGRGKCIDEFCQCEPPYFSIGCTRSKVYPPNHSFPNPTNFKIYMYELNTQLAYDVALTYQFTEHDPIYIAYRFFLDQFLESPVRTEDPSEAHLFFIPAFTYTYAGNMDSPDPHLNIILDHIQQKFPYWNRTDGRDHFLWAPGDQGACYLTELAERPIKIVHFGYHTTPNNLGPVRHEAFPDLNPGQPEYGCLHPFRDVVTPPYEPWDAEFLEGVQQRSLDEIIAEKQRLFFFAGSVRDDTPSYSGGTRQQLKALAAEWTDPDLLFVDGYAVGNYSTLLRASKFCLAPYGYGWGNRLPQAVLAGCVPVIVQEHVVQPFQNLLEYEAFSIQLANEDLPRLREILRSVSEEQYRRLLEGVLRHQQAFCWRPDLGCTAFEYTLLSLRRTYMNMKALLYI